MDPITLLEARAAEIQAEIDTLISAAETESRAISDDEQTGIDTLVAEHRSVESKIASLKAANERRAARSTVDPVVQPGRTEERTAPYEAGGQQSYFKDLYLATQKQNRAAVERLEANDRHRADKARESKVDEIRAMSTTNGIGGEFAPPLWQIENFVAYRRPGRPTADLLNHEVLPMGVSSINLPKVTTGALTGAQAGQNTPVSNRDFATTSVTGNVATVAGQVIVSQQELDQTPINLDSVILNDLQKDYDFQLDAAAIAAIVAAAGNTITYTSGTPSSAGVLQAIQQGIDAIHQGIFSPAKAVVMRPDRWGRLIAASDGQGRPLVLPSSNYGPMNVVGRADGQNAQGVAGDVRGLPSILDASIPNNLGAGANQDEVLVFDPTQVWLYESAPHAETFKETYAGQLSVLFRFYSYYSLIANRLPKAISVIAGTGMIPGSYGA